MERIESLDDPRVAGYRNLRDRTLRGESIFLAEGRLVAKRLLASPYPVESILVSEELSGEFLDPTGTVPVYVARDAILREVVGFNFHLGVLAIGRRCESRSLDEVLDPLAAADSVRLAICPAVTKPENLGLIFRTASALAVDGIVLGRQSCDPFSRRAMRVSMGAVLQVPLVRSTDLAADLARLKDRHHVHLSAAVLDDQAMPLDQTAWPARAAVLLGNEYDGLAPTWLSLCDRLVTIPMRPGVDSLNLGVAAGVFLYQMMQSRR